MKMRCRRVRGSKSESKSAMDSVFSLFAISKRSDRWVYTKCVLRRFKKVYKNN